MSREPQRPDPAADEVDRWLDGLTGREGHGSAHAEGLRLREALLPDTAVDMPAWEEIRRRAESMPHPQAHPGRPAGPAPLPARPDAANRPFWRPWHGLAAGLALCVVLASSMWPGGDEALRSIQPSSATEATWRAPAPADAAKTLSDELRALGATVQLQHDGPGVRLQITAAPAAVPAVNQRLAGLETAVDAQGRLSLRILPP